jgi:hypothetical protein
MPAGKLLAFYDDVKMGLICANDNLHYRFTIDEWRSFDPPVPGQPIRFVIQRGVVTDVALDAQPAH